MKYDCVVIGSGVGGLTAGLILGLFGRKVAIVEQRARTAPLIRRFRRDGVWCDTGFHYCGGLRPGEGFSTLLRFLGVHDSLGATPMNPEAYDTIVSPAGEPLRLPVGLPQVREALSRRFPASRKAVEVYIDRVDAIHRMMPFASGNERFDEASLHEDSTRTIGSFLRESGAQEEMLTLFDGYGTILHGTGIDETSLFVHAMVVGSYYYAAHTFARGGDALVEAFDRRLREVGVDVLCNRRALSIRADDQRRVIGVEVGDGAGRDLLECDLCIGTIHPKLLVDILPRESVAPRFFTWVERMEETFSPFVVHLDLETIPKALRNGNVYLFHEDYHGLDTPALAILGATFPRDDSQRKSVSLLRVAWQSPPAGLCPGRSIGRDSGDDGADASCEGPRSAALREFEESMTQSMLDDFETAFPEAKGKHKVLTTCSPCVCERRAGSWRGSIYGVKHVAGQRELGPTGPLRGLFLAGQNTSVASGVMGAITSSFLATAQILGWENLWSKVLACRNAE